MSGRTRAVVLGGGVAGLLAARVLEDHVDDVLILERDHYPEAATARRGAYQGTQVHALLARGGQIIEELFPGFADDMDRLGATRRDFGTDLWQWLGDVEMPRDPTGIPMRVASRPMIEGVLLRQVRQRSKIRIVEGCQVEGLLASDGRVRGVRIKPHYALGVRVEADLVVDATGRASSVLKWLEALGLPAPATETVDAGFGYATASLIPPDDADLDGCVALAAMASPPDFPVTGILFALPDGTWQAAQIALRGHHPRTDPAGFVDGFRRLGWSGLYDRLREARVEGAVVPYKQASNRWRRFDRMPTWPGGYVALGDAVCALNPRFGQGMTVAALSAEALGRWLASTGSPSDLGIGANTLRFQKQLARIQGVAWMMATGDDASWLPEPPTGLKARLTQAYFGRIVTLSARDPGVYVRFMRVAQMLDGPLNLLAPDLIVRALLLRRGGGGSGAPGERGPRTAEVEQVLDEVEEAAAADVRVATASAR